MKKGFAQRLRLLRGSFGISQVRLASALGAQQSYVAKWEAEAYDPSEALKKRIARFFQVSPSWLMEGVGPIFSGIVFIPMFIHMLRKGFKLEKWVSTAMLVAGDGAFVDRIALNADHEEEAVLLFSRGEDLRLFMHFGVPSHGSRHPSGAAAGIEGVLERISGQPGTGGSHHPAPRSPGIFRLPENTFRLISPLSTLEGIERLLSMTIPAGLKKTGVSNAPGRQTRLGELVGLIREEAMRELRDRDFDNSACRFLLSVEDESTLKGILFLVPELMKSLKLDDRTLSDMSAIDLKKSVLHFCEGTCGW